MGGELVGGIRQSRVALDKLRSRVGQDETAALHEALETLSTVLEELRRQNEVLRATRRQLRLQARAYWDLFDLAPDAYVITDPDGAIKEANRAAEQLLGVPFVGLQGRALPTFVPEEHRGEFRARLLKVAAGAEADEWEFPLRPRGQAVITVAAKVRLALDADDEISALRWQLRDVTEARHAQQQLQAAYSQTSAEYEHLLELDQWKDAFFTAAAHDLGAPLTVISGTADTLLRHPDLDGGLPRELVQHIQTASQRLKQLLSELLDLDRFTRGHVQPDRRPTDVLALAQGVIDDVNNSHAISLSGTAAVANVDARRVEQIVTNLVRNAVTHTPEGTPIRVSVSADGPTVTIVVEDDGPGVPQDVRDSLFLPFVTLGAHEADPGGSGIGLSLVQQFAMLHGGDASLEECPSGGARFVVKLPDAEDTA